MTDTARLRELATQATPGPWETMSLGPMAVGVVSVDRYVIHSADAMVEPAHRTDREIADARRQSAERFAPLSRDAAYIAAANPTAILSLLDELDASKARIAEVEAWERVAEPLADLADVERRIMEAVRANKGTSHLEDELGEATAIVVKAYRSIAPPPNGDAK